MKFMSTWSVRPGCIEDAATRFLSGKAEPPKGVKILGRWQVLPLRKGTQNKEVLQIFPGATLGLRQHPRLAGIMRHSNREGSASPALFLFGSSHKATIESDKIHLRWLDRFLGEKHLDTFSRA